MTIYEIIESVAAIGSTKAKQEILEANKSNEVLKNCFLYAENPRFNFYIRIKDVRFAAPGTRDLDQLTFTALNRLINREVTGNAARDFIEEIMIPLTSGARDILARIINRDLRCGCGTSIANKVWGNIIPEYPVMLASKFDEKAVKYLGQFENNVGFIVQKKCDGGRINVRVTHDGTVTYHSRNGSTLELFGFFDGQFSRFINTVFDGELLIRANNGVEDRQTGNGLYTKAVRGTLSKSEVSRFSMEVWDTIPIDDFDGGFCPTPYKTRLGVLEASAIAFDSKLVTVVEGEYAKTLAECLVYYEAMRARGEEGALIKVADAPWEDARSKKMVKLKAVNDIDAICVGTEFGTGKYANMIGNLICQDSTGMLQFNVGTGLTDADRVKDPSAYIGKIIECVYNSIITSKNKNTKSLFLPVFKSIRVDKNKANALSELK